MAHVIVAKLQGWGFFGTSWSFLWRKENLLHVFFPSVVQQLLADPPQALDFTTEVQGRDPVRGANSSWVGRIWDVMSLFFFVLVGLGSFMFGRRGSGVLGFVPSVRLGSARTTICTITPTTSQSRGGCRQICSCQSPS